MEHLQNKLENILNQKDPRQTQYIYDERHVDINYFNKMAKAQEQFYTHQRHKRIYNWP